MTNITTYWRVFLTFARNSLVRDMTFRGNFIIDTISSLSWPAFNVVFYQRVFTYTGALGNSGWSKYEFFAFFATGLIINASAQMLFMTNIDEFTDLIRTGDLDFLLLKPIDTQFLISLKRIEWSSLGNFLAGVGFLIYSLAMLSHLPGLLQIVLFLVYTICGVAIYYSLMIALGAATVWMGRNLTLYDFWFYITNISLPAGDLSRQLRRPAADLLHLPVARFDRDQRARADDRLAARFRAMAAGRLRLVGCCRQRGRLAVAVSDGAEQLSQREQLTFYWRHGVSTLHLEPSANAVTVTEDELVVDLVDGRRMSVPLSWYPRLLNATAAERQNCRLLGDGYAIEWPDLDEHIGIEGLLAGRASGESGQSLERWLAARRKK